MRSFPSSVTAVPATLAHSPTLRLHFSPEDSRGGFLCHPLLRKLQSICLPRFSLREPDKVYEMVVSRCMNEYDRKIGKNVVQEGVSCVMYTIVVCGT